MNNAERLSKKVLILLDKGDFQNALPLAQEALEIRQSILGDQHSDYAISLATLASVYDSAGEYTKAESLFLQALDIHKKVLGEEHLYCAVDSANLARLYDSMGEYAKAKPLLIKACDTFKAVLGEQNPQYASSLSNLAGLYFYMGDYTKAKSLYVESLAIRKQVLGEQHPDYASSLNNLATLYNSTGEYAKVEPLLLQASDIFKSVWGEQHPSYADSLNNLALLYNSIGEFAKAEQLMLQANEIRKKVLGELHPKYADSLCGLAMLYYTTGEYAKAERLYMQASDIRKKVLGEHHPLDATSQCNLGLLYYMMGKSAKAESLFLESLAIEKMTQGEQTPLYATYQNSLALLYESRGEYAKAEPRFLEALAIRKKALGEQHPDYALCLYNVALLYHRMGKYDKAADLYYQSAKIDYELAATMVAAVSEAQALNYSARHLGPPRGLLSIWRHTDKPDDELYDCVWMCRGLIQQITAKRQKQLYHIANADVRKQYQYYQDTRRSLAQVILTPIDSDPKLVADQRKRIEGLNVQKEKLERQLAAELPEFRRQLDSDRRSPRDLTAHLMPDMAYVDLVRYDLIEQDPDIPGKAGLHQTESYTAFILQKGTSMVRVELGPAASIDAAVARWHDEIVHENRGSTAQELRHLVWEPIESKLPRRTKTVYLCPDGKLTSIPWVALPGRKEGTVLLEDYAMAVVPNGRFLLQQLTATPLSAEQRGQLLVVGDVSYDQEPVQVVPRPEWLAYRDAVRDGKQLRWPPLPGSKKELESVIGLAGTRTVIKLDGASAGTTSVLAKLPEARWAHFATHGFFADPKIRSGLQVDETVFGLQESLSGMERRTVAGRNPLVLSGLILAGANQPRKKDSLGIAQGDGGILTAEAIASMPLEKLELAVLSACDTGLGDVAGGEGVFGLQRAFHSAGARSVVASLWMVNDQATAALMQLFYYKLWKEQKPPIEALRQAQLTLYRHPNSIPRFAVSRGLDFEKLVQLPDEGKRSSTPGTAATSQWAGFILSGIGY